MPKLSTIAMRLPIIRPTEWTPPLGGDYNSVRTPRKYTQHLDTLIQPPPASEKRNSLQIPRMPPSRLVNLSVVSISTVHRSLTSERALDLCWR